MRLLSHAFPSLRGSVFDAFMNDLWVCDVDFRDWLNMLFVLTILVRRVNLYM